MTRKTCSMYGLTLVAACISSPGSAAELPRSGTYSGQYGWTFTGQVKQLGFAY